MRRLVLFSVVSLVFVATSRAEKEREVSGRMVRDAALDLCIDNQVIKAVECLKKHGYLSGHTKEDGDEAKESATIGPGKGLMTNPGKRIEKPRFGPMAAPVRQTGPESSKIEISGPSNTFGEAKGPHAGPKDKLPPPSPAR